MIIKIAAIIVMAVFYAAYLGKKMSQKRQGVKTNQIAVGNKPRNVMMVEKVMGVATFMVIPAELLSIALYPKLTLVPALRDCMPMQIAGVAIAAIGLLVAFPNVIHLACAMFAVVMLHLQILNEEKYCAKIFGNEYEDYCKRVRRYL